MRSAVLLAVALAVAAPAWAGAGTRPQGVLRGVVSRGPVTPVCSPATPCSEPAPGVTLVFLRRGRPVARARSGAGGAYRVVLAAGRYAIRVRGWRRFAPTHALVRAGRVSRLDIAIDTGIR